MTTEATEGLATRIGFIRETQCRHKLYIAASGAEYSLLSDGKFWDFTSDLAKGDTAYTTLALGAHTDNTYFVRSSSALFELQSNWSFPDRSVRSPTLPPPLARRRGWSHPPRRRFLRRVDPKGTPSGGVRAPLDDPYTRTRRGGGWLFVQTQSAWGLSGFEPRPHFGGVGASEVEQRRSEYDEPSRPVRRGGLVRAVHRLLFLSANFRTIGTPRFARGTGY